MTMEKKGGYWYGSTIEDLQMAIVDFSKSNGYTATRFAQSLCQCGSKKFRLESDEDVGAARRSCVLCGQIMLMGDSVEHAHEASFEDHLCVCDADVFELLSGVALYDQSDDIRWYYIGCHCVVCDLVGVFAEWKCEAGNVGDFLSSV